jgi:hypothetical protein
MKPMDSTEYTSVVGSAPEQDDLDRANCASAGQIGHAQCGLCDHRMPRFLHCARCAARKAWANWLASYGADKFHDAFLASAQGAQSTCVHCGEEIFLDLVEGGGVPDWGSAGPEGPGLDYGCPESPDTGPDGTGGHVPQKLDNAS